MKNSNFWFLTLCALLVIASVNGWNLPIRVAVTANALVVLAEITKQAWTLFKRASEN